MSDERSAPYPPEPLAGRSWHLLRRERYQLQQLVRELALTQGRALELRVLQYGATRQALLQGIAAAVTDAGLRPELETVLADLETKGWKLHQPVQRIWGGERDGGALTASLDDQDSALIRRILELLEE